MLYTCNNRLKFELTGFLVCFCFLSLSLSLSLFFSKGADIINIMMMQLFNNGQAIVMKSASNSAFQYKAANTGDINIVTCSDVERFYSFMFILLKDHWKLNECVWRLWQIKSWNSLFSVCLLHQFICEWKHVVEAWRCFQQFGFSERQWKRCKII